MGAQDCYNTDEDVRIVKIALQTKTADRRKAARSAVPIRGPVGQRIVLRKRWEGRAADVRLPPLAPSGPRRTGSQRV